MRFVAGALERIVATRVADAMGEEPEMQRNLSTADRGLRAGILSLALVSALVISGCGPLGGDDNEPTSTTETIDQPTTSVQATNAATPTGETPSAFSPQSTPGPFRATPALPGENGGTPVTTNQGTTGIPGTPVASDGATPAAAIGDDIQGTPPAFTGSDGTSGATPGTGASDVVTEEAVTTPPGDGEFFVEEVATPDETSILGMTPVEVASCEPEAVPELVAEQPEFITIVDVNFRDGPGEDCDEIGDDPIAVSVPVTVLSGPVVREEDDTFIWVQVQIDDETGWIVVDAIEPAT